MSSSSMYGHANVGRAGLANCLLPWARCEIFCNIHRIPMLAPQWSVPKIGPLLRGERDLRYYVGLFSNKSYVRGLHKWALLATSRKISEKDAQTIDLTKSGPGIVVFSGVERLFEPLMPHQEFIARRLRQILSDKTRRTFERQPIDYHIAVHVRRGDKPPLAPGEPAPSPSGGANWHWTLPNSWYVNAIRSVREVLGTNASVKIFSDGRPEQLRELLEMPEVKLADENSSIVDILLLSRGKVLITSPSSTFSWWAAFLGQMPTVWYPNWCQRLHPARPDLDIATEVEGFLTNEARSVLLDVRQSLPI